MGTTILTQSVLSEERPLLASKATGRCVGSSSPPSFKTQLYLEANCKQRDGELLLLPINYPAVWDDGVRRGIRVEEMMPSQHL